jgi:hypothetical protein
MSSRSNYLGQRVDPDASDDVGNLLTALDLKKPDVHVPQLPQREGPPFVRCPEPFPADDLSRAALGALNLFPPLP